MLMDHRPIVSISLHVDNPTKLWNSRKILAQPSASAAIAVFPSSNMFRFSVGIDSDNLSLLRAQLLSFPPSIWSALMSLLRLRLGLRPGHAHATAEYTQQEVL